MNQSSALNKRRASAERGKSHLKKSSVLAFPHWSLRNYMGERKKNTQEQAKLKNAAVRSSTLCATYKIYLQCVIKDIEVFSMKCVRA